MLDIGVYLVGEPTKNLFFLTALEEFSGPALVRIG